MATTLWLVASGANAATIDLSTWTAESYPAVAGFGAGVWTVAPGGASVTQSVNGQPTLFVSDFNAAGSDLRGRLRVNSASDNDYIGFALGYRNGDASNAAANYLLIDWKQGSQFFDFGLPSASAGGIADVGLAISRVTGIPNADELWQHSDDPGAPGGGVEELARGATLGNTGWGVGVDYEIRFIFEADRIRVFVDDVLQIDVAGVFADGRFAFYNFSQADVTYSAFERDPVLTPEPGSLLLLGAGLAALTARRAARGRA